MKKIALSLFLVSGFLLAQNPILLTYESTRFKTSLIEEMQTILTAKGYTVETLDHSKGALQEISVESYSAIFITNSGVNSKVRPWVSDWLSDKAGSPILLHTTQQKEWSVESTVDAVTSASARKEVTTLAQTYTEQLITLIPVPSEE